VGGADGDPSLPVDGGLGLVLVAHRHLPVVAAGGERRAAQHDDHRVEAPRVAGQVLPRPQVPYLSAVLGQLQPGVGRVGVKGQVG